VLQLGAAAQHAFNERAIMTDPMPENSTPEQKHQLLLILFCCSVTEAALHESHLIRTSSTPLLVSTTDVPATAS
jgi:hypothetical protein